MRKIIFSILATVIVLTSCNDTPPSADQVQAEHQEQSLSEAQNEIGDPSIKNFEEKKQLKRIYELCDQQNLIMYAYLYSNMTGLKYLGKCIGYGIPYATQYSNPQKYTRLEVDGTHEYITLPQAEPNGVFKPATAAATWLDLLDKKGHGHIVYVEPDVVVSPIPLGDTTKIDY